MKQAKKDKKTKKSKKTKRTETRYYCIFEGSDMVVDLECIDPPVAINFRVGKKQETYDLDSINRRHSPAVVQYTRR